MARWPSVKPFSLTRYLRPGRHPLGAEDWRRTAWGAYAVAVCGGGPAAPLCYASSPTGTTVKLVLVLNLVPLLCIEVLFVKVHVFV